MRDTLREMVVGEGADGLLDLIGDLEAAKSLALNRLNTPPPPVAVTDDALVPMVEAARLLGVHEQYARELARNGELPVVRMGRAVRVRLSAIREFVKQRERESAGRK